MLDAAHAAKALMWLVFSARQLFLEELIEACAIDPVQPQILGHKISPCDFFELMRDLILIQPHLLPDQESVTAGTHTVILTHASLSEFLKSLATRPPDVPSQLSAFALGQRESNLNMAQSCLAYLFHYNKYDLRHSEYPLRRYAWYHWEEHVETLSEYCPLTSPTAVFRRKAARLFRVIKHLLNMCKGHSPPENHTIAQEDLKAINAIFDSLHSIKTHDSQTLEGLKMAIEVPFFDPHYDDFCPPDRISVRTLSYGMSLYPPLSKTDMPIRLIQILPSIDPETTIKCRLFSVDLETAPPYQALSYAWPYNTQVNPSTGTIRVTINGTHTTRRSTEVELLRAMSLRAGHSSPAIWYNGICINQWDFSEMGQQIGMIGAIFSKAMEVVVSLGGAATGDDKVVELLAETTATSIRLMSKATNQSTRAESTETILRINKEEGWRDISRIFDNRWWTRFWAIQEIILAISPVIIFGGTSFRFNIIEQLVFAEPFIEEVLAESEGSTLPELQKTPGWKAVREMVRARHDYRVRGNLELPVLLWRFRYSIAKDPRDGIYAFLGLCNPEVSEVLQPDYSISERDLSANVSRCILNRHERLDQFSILPAYHCRNRQSCPIEDIYCSWALPLLLNNASSIKRKPLILGIFDDSDTFKTYKACGDMTTAVFYSSPRNVLAVHGLSFDHILFGTGDGPNLYDWQIRDGFSLATLCSKIRRTQVGLSPSQGTVEARWRTLLANQWPPGTRLTSTEFQGVPLPPTTVEEESRLLALEARRTPWVDILQIRRVVITFCGRLGLVPEEAESGDSIVVMPGGAVPYVLRQKGNNTWVLIGEWSVRS